MTPKTLADLHARCFQTPRPYSIAEFSTFLESPDCYLCAEQTGFALERIVVDEVELLTLAVEPDHRRKGTARKLLATFEHTASNQGAVTFLEVAENNKAAIELYRAIGYRESGRRNGYYRTQSGTRIDAILMDKSLKTC